MKRVKLILFFASSLFFISCAEESDAVIREFEEQGDTSEEAEENSVDEEENVEDEDLLENNEEVGIISDTVCTFEALGVVAGEEIEISCLVDLDGQTINVPSSVTFTFAGGDIYNGTLNFQSNGKIAGELLNAKLNVEGDVSLISSEFDFYAFRWDIIEGNVTAEVAENNKVLFNEVLELVGSLVSGVVDFNVDDFDAYFKVDGTNEWDIELATLGIKIPSNYNFNLTDTAYFRMYPNASTKPTLVYIGEGVENVTITGGKFIGDRDEHDYVDNSTHEWGHLLRVGGATNVTITGAEFSDATGDGIDVHAFGHSFDANHIQSTEVYITGNTFKRNRRNQISVTSGEYVYIENNEFIDASIDTEGSEGIAPGFAIDIEAYRANGIEYEIAENIFISNNTETGSRVGSFTIHTGDLITIENNTVDNFISYSNTHGSVIRNNTITSVTDNTANGGVAILAGRSDRYDLNYNNTITGNTITGYGTGITVTNVAITVAQNELINCERGIVLEEIKNADFYDNKIISSKDGSTGYSSGAAATFIDNVTIRQTSNETLIDVSSDPFKFVNINEADEYANYSFTIENNIVTSVNTSTIASRGIILNGNEIKNGGIRLSNAENISISQNTISSATANAIRIDSGCLNVTIEENIFISTLDCVFENNTDAENVVLINNTCNEL